MAVEAALLSSLELIGKLLAPEVLEYLGPLWYGVDDELTKLRRAIHGIQGIIRDAEERQVEEDRAVKDWLTELKHAAYDAEDVLDQANTHLLVQRRKSEIHGHLMSQVCNFFSLDNPLFFLPKLGSELKGIIKRIDGIMKEMHEFKFKVYNQEVYNQAPQRTRPQTYSFVVESEMVGRDADRDEIVQSLIDDRHFDENVPVFSIVGMGGLGKTTLAQLVYNDSRVERCFEPRMWVCVSDDFDCVKLARAIIESSTGEQCCLTNLELLQRKLRQVLERTRYLLVLDDVWNEDKEKWDKLRALLTCGQEGSRVVVTTRKENCSSVMNAKVTYRPRCLSEDSSWVLFEQHAFERGVPQHQNMVMIGKKIVSKCGGLPLAIKALGGLMRSKNGEREWQSVLDSEMWNLRPIQDGILPALWFSYVDMPYHLKKCFSFCAVFPKDYEIGKDLLIELWMAHGFIPSEGRKDLEDEGNEIFNELVRRSFLQDVNLASIFSGGTRHIQHVSRFSIGATCKIHDLMHDLALCIVGDEIITRDECFGFGESVESMNIPKGTRHLLWPTRSCVKLSNCQSIRTFTTSDVSDLIKLRTLRALSLEEWSAPLGSTENLQLSTENLQLLRYLDLSDCRALRKLPETICMLVNLQTLKLYNCSRLIELPKRMRYMSSLRHLDIEGCHSLRSMPPGLGQLKCLKTLPIYIVGSYAENNSLQELKDLNLGGRLELRDLYMVKNASDAEKADMQSKKNINSLTLMWGKRWFIKKDFYLEAKNSGEVEAVLEALEPDHFGIKSLEVDSYAGTKFPLWMGALHNLVEICLRNCEECEQPPPLEQLPFLEVLRMRGMYGIKHIINSTSNNTRKVFPALKKLTLGGMSNLEGWCVEEEREAFSSFCPSLITIEISNCPKLGTKKKGFFKNLKSLERLEITWNCGDLLLLLEDEEETMGISSSILGIMIEKCESFSPSLGSWKLPSLKTLRILGDCENLVSWPEEMFRELKSLEYLNIYQCDNLIGIGNGDSSQGFSALPSLQQLDVHSCKKLISLPKCPTSLQRLEVSYCPSIKYLPQGLTSLKSLTIEACPLLESSRHDLQQRFHALESLTILPTPWWWRSGTTVPGVVEGSPPASEKVGEEPVHTVDALIETCEILKDASPSDAAMLIPTSAEGPIEAPHIIVSMVPAVEAPTKEAPIEETPIEEAPTEEAPAQEAPTEEAGPLPIPIEAPAGATVVDAEASVYDGENVQPVRTNFIPKNKRPTGFGQLSKEKQALLSFFLNCLMDSTIVWKNEWAFTTRAHLYPLVEGKEFLSDDVMDVFVMILLEELKKTPSKYKRRGSITRPFALLLSKQYHTMDDSLKIITDAVTSFQNLEVVLMPIILNKHYHLLVLDKESRHYTHYSSLNSRAYDKAAGDMRVLFETALAIEHGHCFETDSYTFSHDRDCPQQREDSVDCPVFVMRFMEQILDGEKLHLNRSEVPRLRLEYVCRILADGFSRTEEPTSTEL